MTVLRWENPPPPARAVRPVRYERHDPHHETAAVLAANPGRWGVVYEGGAGTGTGLASQIRRGRTAAWQPAGDYQAVSRKQNGVTAVYARYVGSQP